MKRTLERMHHAAVIRFVIRNFSRNVLFSVHTKCLNKPAASTEAVTQKMMVSSQIVTHELRPTLTSSYFLTWKRNLVPRPMGEDLVRVRPQEGHCSSFLVRGTPSRRAVFQFADGGTSSRRTVFQFAGGGTSSRRTLFQFAGGGTCSRTLFKFAGGGTCSRRTLFQFADGGTSSRRTLFQFAGWGTYSRTLLQFAANWFLLTVYYNCLTSDIRRSNAHPKCSLCSYFTDSWHRPIAVSNWTNQLLARLRWKTYKL